MKLWILLLISCAIGVRAQIPMPVGFYKGPPANTNAPAGGGCLETPSIILADNSSVSSIYINDQAHAAFVGAVWPSNQPATNLCKLDFRIIPAGTLTGFYWSARVYGMLNATNLNTNSIIATTTPVPGASLFDGYGSFLFPSPAALSPNMGYGWVLYESDASGNPVTSVNGTGWVRVYYDTVGTSQNILSIGQWPLSGVNQYGINPTNDLDLKAYFAQ
jgi:hypothetical protein